MLVLKSYIAVGASRKMAGGARIHEEKEASRNIYYLIINEAGQIMCTICIAKEIVFKDMIIVG